MSTHRGNRSEIRRSFGEFKLTGSDGGRTSLTITTALDDYDFPSDPGEEVVVELVDPDGETPYLEVRPAGGDRP